MSNSYVDVVPLGGLGEIGKNTMAISCGSDMIVIDAGLAFPEEEMLGVDIVIPDYSYLLANKDRIRAIVLTHGHEDHIGGLPYLLREISVPVYGTQLTLALAERKVSEHGLVMDKRLISAGDSITIGSFTIDFFRVLHSIVDGVGLAIHTPIGTIVHSGDFKFDQTPIDGQPADYHKLSSLGQDGVLLLMSDSTNADRAGYTASERDVGCVLDDVFARCGRILVASFASNVPRMQQVAAATVKHDRYLSALGRSMETVLEVALDLGYIDIPPDVLIPHDQLDSVPANKLVVLTTGSQGEPMSALSRIAVGEHRMLTVGSSDTVVISASAVPGNEKMVSRNVDNLLRLGANVIYGERSGVHVSGHASQEELKMMINLIRPQYVLPIHGQYRHLINHADVARSLGIPADHVFVGENGTVFRFTESSGEIIDEVPAGNVLVDGFGIGDVGNVVLRDRKQLAEDGIVVATLVVDRNGLVCEPEVITRGFVYVRESEQLLDEARSLISEMCRDELASRNKIRDALSRLLYQKTGRRPIVLPVFMDLNGENRC